jgi:DNA-binding CsgD family transcriptional regulator
MTDRGGVRRVTVVATTVHEQRDSSAPKDIAQAAPLTLDGGCEQFTRLETVLDKVTNLIRLGEYRTNLEEGVLFDAVVGDVRCLFIELEPARMVSLSPREQQIARMVAWGRTNQAIASSLEISVWTVSTHLRRIFAKLAVSSRAEMVAHLLADPDVARAIERGH